ncbi:hypothetical protein GUITHDRAFT_143201 [Guillardia theta CCMP2712]|uniref:SET domain-containing protein n=1 Tax=Guillardia theta (strain CCMP2712) TaxID=905079 RepID=L1IUQ8_GUITC|nr:hypothetical protein GUITHDRAFT_143201 [Guillardia theta CCMP2712]EKX39812.1 hypothetical protein GUITHDRAFT_143201 [Guillardia theta CCMP2712]|eukprot:XP_005826792.1 hypothetical protein GUITHDRAFT_143201 [Guillardia theta CCMP2712]
MLPVASLTHLLLVSSVLLLLFVSNLRAEPVVIDTHSARGRITVADRNYEVGEEVLAEAASLVWPANSDSSFVLKFLEGGEEEREAILQLAHLPTDAKTERIARLRAAAEEVYDSMRERMEAAGWEEEDVHRLLIIKDTNCFPFYGRRASGYEEGTSVGADRLALFPRCAKVNHSCRPNVMFSSQTEDGKLRLIAMRRIERGEEVTFSYLGEDGDVMSREERRERMRGKDFLCSCARCEGVDDVRGIRCPACGIIRYPLPETAAKEEEEAGSAGGVVEREKWTACRCEGEGGGDSVRDLVEWEEEAGRRMLQFLGKCRDFDRQLPDPRELEEMVKEAQGKLSPSHFLVAQGQELLAKVWSSYAHRMEKREDFVAPFLLSSRDCRGRAARSFFLAIRVREELEEKWEEGRECSKEETGVNSKRGGEEGGGRREGGERAVFSCTRLAFSAAENLMRSEMKEWREEAEDVTRYVKMMKRRYGEDDEDVRKIERFVNELIV